MSLLDGDLDIYQRWAHHYRTCSICKVGDTPDQDRFCDESNPLRREAADARMTALHQSFTFGEVLP